MRYDHPPVFTEATLIEIGVNISEGVRNDENEAKMPSQDIVVQGFYSLGIVSYISSLPN